MNNLNQSIRALKREIAISNKNISAILAYNPAKKAIFNAANAELDANRKNIFKTKTLGASDDTPWYENSFVNRLLDVGTAQLSSKNEQKSLQLELDKVAEQNKQLDKQLSLQQRFKSAGQYGGSFVDELMNSPIKLLAIGGLVVFALKNKFMKK